MSPLGETPPAPVYLNCPGISGPTWSKQAILLTMRDNFKSGPSGTSALSASSSDPDAIATRALRVSAPILAATLALRSRILSLATASSKIALPSSCSKRMSDMSPFGNAWQQLKLTWLEQKLLEPKWPEPEWLRIEVAPRPKTRYVYKCKLSFCRAAC